MVRRCALLAVLSLALTACRSETATCGRMKDLCGTTEESCKELFKSTRETFGEKGVDAMKTCFADATSCSEASGCVAGVGLKGLTDSATEFLEGMKKGTEKK